MKIISRVSNLYLRLALSCLAIFCAGAVRLPAQTPAAPAVAQSASPASGQSQAQAQARVHNITELDGLWRFQVGDDPRWADPAFDDSAWPTATVSKALSEQGFDAYSGYGWYRLKLQPQQLSQFNNLPGNPSPDILVTGDSIGQLAVYVNGVESGHTQGMTDDPSMYLSPPLVVHLSHPAADGTILLAIRTWAGPSATIHRGLIDKVELAAPDDISEKLTASTDRRWDQHLIAGIMVSFLFLCVAALGLTLFMAQRKHPEYLWLALLCLSVAFMGTSETFYGLALLPYSIFFVLSLWGGRIFMAATLEFILRFTGSQYRRAVRIFQISVLLLPFLALLHLTQTYEYLAISSEVVFSVLVSFLLFRAWRRGRPDAGVMLAPFFLAATADSLDTILDYSVQQHWIPERFAFHEFHLGPIAFPISNVSYAVFLGSLLAVIFYRFIHVSQEEQRSSAEIEAARSVQAMLIPTELPSNHNFMLESAYLPANGVGGDFFQVLPLKDESMLIVVGDVSGKGLQAAMNASTLVGALRNELSHDPATVLNRLNNVLLCVGGDIQGGRRTLCCADQQASRGVHAVAKCHAKSESYAAGERASCGARYCGRFDSRGYKARIAHGALLLRRLRLDV
jgi:hypothetical protein